MTGDVVVLVTAIAVLLLALMGAALISWWVWQGGAGDGCKLDPRGLGELGLESALAHGTDRDGMQITTAGTRRGGHGGGYSAGGTAPVRSTISRYASGRRCRAKSKTVVR